MGSVGEPRPVDYYFWMKDWAVSSGFLLSDVYKPFAIEASPPPFVAVIPGGYVYGNDGTVISPDHLLIWEVSYDWSNDPHKHNIFQLDSLPPVQSISGNVAVLTKIGSSNYYHWMYDVLPRIYLLACSGVSIDRYIVSEGLQPFQYETLEALGIGKHQLIESHANFHIQAERLIVPSIGFGQKWVYHFLRSKFLQQKPQQSRRLYISRTNTVGRVIVNEAEVIQELKGYGFETVYPEQLSVTEQSKLFASAAYVVAPTGSALTNLTFCSSEVKVLEFFSPNFIVNDIKRICGFGGLQHNAHFGLGVRPPSYEGSSWYWYGLDNIVVDISELRRGCSQMGL
ncbi:MAG: glycosyltransferase family 61 protein [Gorillibacterium sp.]|nr:glycosyltransferase family 61 protein [Gorillibacterium sp.]